MEQTNIVNARPNTPNRKEHEITKDYGGIGISGWIQPKCSCGWVGDKHYAHQDFQHLQVKEDINDHLKEVKNVK